MAQKCPRGIGKDDGRIRRFLAAVWAREKLSGKEGNALMNLCMAATYDPDASAPLGFRVPYHLETGERLEARWKRWLAHDPINLVTKYKANLRKPRDLHRLRLARPVPHPVRVKDPGAAVGGGGDPP